MLKLKKNLHLKNFDLNKLKLNDDRKSKQNKQEKQEKQKHEEKQESSSINNTSDESDKTDDSKTMIVTSGLVDIPMSLMVILNLIVIMMVMNQINNY